MTNILYCPACSKKTTIRNSDQLSLFYCKCNSCNFKACSYKNNKQIISLSIKTDTLFLKMEDCIVTSYIFNKKEFIYNVNLSKTVNDLIVNHINNTFFEKNFFQKLRFFLFKIDKNIIYI